MRQEDLVRGLDRSPNDRSLLQQNEDEFVRGQAELYDEQVADTSLESRSRHDDVLAAVSAIFRKENLSFDELHLSTHERAALESLRAAQTGKDTHYEGFLYAEQRREMLEQALAALQPTLALDISVVPELHENYEHLVAQISLLRERLTNLEDSQDDELLMQRAAQKEEEGDGDEGDDDDSDETEDEDGDEAQDGDAAPGERSDAEPASAQTKTGDRDEAVEPTEPGDVKSGVISRLGRALGLGKKADDDDDDRE